MNYADLTKDELLREAERAPAFGADPLFSALVAMLARDQFYYPDGRGLEVRDVRRQPNS